MPKLCAVEVVTFYRDLQDKLYEASRMSLLTYKEAVPQQGFGVRRIPV